MLKALRLLLVEDSQDDADILLRVLSRDGYDVTCRRVQTAAEMREALASESWDVVIADYSMPRFSGHGALALLHETGLDLPFIIVSGTIGEELAVALLKSGAHDFLVKGRFARLSSVIERERRDAHERAERRRAQEALRQSEAKYRRIVETGKEGVWVTDAQGVTRYVNERMADLLGCTPATLIGTPISDHVDVAARPAIEACHRGSGISELHDIEFHRTDGTRFVSRLSVGAFPDDQGRNTGVLFMVTDTTEQRKLNAQLIVSDRMCSVGLLAAGVAHEINNPLATLVACLDTVNDGIASMPAAVKASLESRRCTANLRQAREAAERVREIAQDLRIYSRAGDDQWEPVDLQVVMESAIRMAGVEIRHRAQLIRDFRPTPAVNASASRLGQVFLNLLVNAAQAIPEGAAGTNKIGVTLRPGEEGDDHAIVEVSDSGCGISSEVMSQLFTPFFTTKEPGIGTGLGLSICQRIVGGMGGTISVRSAPGAGTTFSVRLPLARPQPVATAAAMPGAACRRSVLVIDDEPAMVSAVQRMLSGMHDVTGCTSPRQALTDIRAGVRFDVILCDLMMQEMSGMALHAALTSTTSEQAKRMLFLTGGAFTPQTVAFLEREGIRHMEKPCDRSLLLKAIEDICTS
ncbi:MAG: response regulator [Pseudomonadota bacterium]